MTKQEEDKYLDQWMSGCFICKAPVAREDMSLIHTTTELTRYPEHAEPYVITSYMACPSCVARKELV